MNAIQRKKLRTVAVFVVAAAMSGFVIGSLFVAMGDPEIWPPRLGAIIGAVAGLGIGLSEEFLVPRLSRRWGYHRVNAYRLLLYSALIVGSIVLANAALSRAATGRSMAEGAAAYFNEGIFLRDVAFAGLAAVIAIALLQLSKLYRLEEIFQLLTGKYHDPEEEERVVLFVDIVDSSAIVERLSPLRASRFLRDCFSDISEPVQAWGGHVYQHLGDGVVVTWAGAGSSHVERSVRCFFEIMRALSRRRDHYAAEYQVAPEVRAGLHAGTVAATWVGEAKRELALHGDALHVAARLQSLCRQEGATCLASKDWLQRTVLPEELAALDLGVLNLRGRSKGVHCYDIRLADPLPLPPTD